MWLDKVKAILMAPAKVPEAEEGPRVAEFAAGLRMRYPAMLVVTADHDVRVAPLHSYKFAAALQAAQAGPQPILLRVETTSGHGGGTTMTSQIDQGTELFAFFASALGMTLR